MKENEDELLLKQGYCPYDIPKSSHLTPDNPAFHDFPINLAILTKYGRYVFLRHGNEERCSSFFATLATIVNKLELSFGNQNSQANFKKFKQGSVQFYLLRRGNFMYIFWDKDNTAQLRLYSMVDFLHYQFISSLTSKVDRILDDNQTYDPTVNFGKSRSIQNLLHYAIENGLHSLPVLFNSFPSLPVSTQLRNQINIISSIKEYKEDGLLLSVLMTMNSIISVQKKKSLEMNIKDLLLFFNLLQGQSTLAKSENWFPICLPGIDSESLLFCYLNYISSEIIHVMIADESQIFPSLSAINKNIKAKLEEVDLLNKIQKAEYRYLIDDPSLDNKPLMSHFVIRNKMTDQIVMSKGQCFGDNKEFLSEFPSYQNIYSDLFKHLLTVRHGRKQKLHIANFSNNLSGGYYEDGVITIFFIYPSICDLDEAKLIISSILRLTKQEEMSLFVSKF